MGRVAARKPLLSHQNRVKRLPRPKTGPPQGRKKVLWTDKSDFDILSSLGNPHSRTTTFQMCSHIIIFYVYILIYGIYNCRGVLSSVTDSVPAQENMRITARGKQNTLLISWVLTQELAWQLIKLPKQSLMGNISTDAVLSLTNSIVRLSYSLICMTICVLCKCVHSANRDEESDSSWLCITSTSFGTNTHLLNAF